MKTKRTALAVRPGSKKSAAAAAPGKATEQKLEQVPAPAQTDTFLNAKEVEAGKAACDWTGTEQPEVGLALLNDIADVSRIGDSSGDPNKRLFRGLLTLHEIKPKGVLQSMLAVQMMAVHNAALTCMRTAFLGNVAFGSGGVLIISRAVRLMSLFNEQLDAMARLKGTAGQQKVTVEHVHVNAGGQAIVGTIAAATVPEGGGGGGKTETRTP